MKRKLSFYGIAIVLTVALAVVLSPLASSHPDGLEKVAEEKGFLEQADGQEVWHGSPLPDYSLPGLESDTLSTSLAGLLGSIVTLVIAVSVGRMISKRDHRDR